MKTKLLLWGVLILLIFAYLLVLFSEEIATENAEDTTCFMSTRISDTMEDSLVYNDILFEHLSDYNNSDFTSNITICEAGTVFIEGADVVIIQNKDTEVYLYETE